VAELRETGEHVCRPDARAVAELRETGEHVCRPDARAVTELREAGEHADARAVAELHEAGEHVSRPDARVRERSSARGTVGRRTSCWSSHEPRNRAKCSPGSIGPGLPCPSNLRFDVP